MTETQNGLPATGDQMLDAAPIALLLLDIAGVIVRVNRAAERLLRRPRVDILGRTGDSPEWRITTFEGEPVVLGDLPFRRALRGEDAEPMTISVAAPNGQRLYLNVSAAPLRSADGRVEGAIVAVADFSEVRQARDELSKSRARKAYALDAAGMIVWDWDPETDRFEHSGAPATLSQFLPRRDLLAMINPQDRGRVREAFEAAFESGGEFNCEYRLSHDAGDERWVLSRGRTATGYDGRPRMSGVLIDITRRKKVEMARAAAQEALALTEERFRLAIEGTDAGVYDLDLGTGETIWTPNVFVMLGYAYAPGGRATREMFHDVLHPDDLESVRAAHARADAALGPLAVEYRIRKADTHEERWLSSYGRVYQVAGSRRAIGIVFDITDRKRAEERERLLMREVDHRAKNVLAVVQSVLQLTPHDDIETYVSTVSGRIGAIARVHTLLADSHWISASVTALIEAELAAYRQQPGRISLSGPDAAAAPDAAQAIAMVIHELATNAAKYGALSAPDGRLSITLARDEDEVILDWVEHTPHPVSRPPEPGFGFRLVATLVEKQLEGSIVYDWREHGLGVCLTLPGLSPQPPHSFELPPEEADQELGELIDRAILVVEDDALVSMAIEEALKEAGGRVRAFRTIDDALNSVRKTPPEFAVLDVNIRGVPVTPVAAELAQRGVPFVYATGYSDDLAELPPAAIIRKPYAPDEIRNALQRLARSH